ncbi:hypothetical protein [Bifidobacterium crudilactis]|uniref:hypothetical protein n=1 Tax=Bifidobacterium crudilactis TaxID=327277 RepID=UPI00054D520A|nr:hypothetical protein [Bifidobacterium crudilactis]
MKMPKNKKSLYQRLTEVSGDPQTITELSRCHPDDPSSESLIHNEAKGHNLDVFAGRFADKHSLPPVCTDQGECPMKPSSCDSIFVMNNGDIYLVEYKKTGVYKNGNYVVNDTHDYQIEILKNYMTLTSCSM